MGWGHLVQAFKASLEPTIVFPWGAPEDFFFEPYFMFIDNLDITSRFLFQPMEGSLKWEIMSLFILFYLFTVTEHLPYKDLWTLSILIFTKNPVY